MSAAKETFDELVQLGCFAADLVVIGFDGTPAERTRLAISRALGALLANGMIEIKDPATWPFGFTPSERYSEETL